MPKLPALTSKKLIQVIKKIGFQLDHVSGSHFIFYHPQDKRRITVPFHTNDVPTGTIISILKQAGVSKDEIIKYL